MKSGRFGVAMAPFGLRLGPAGAKWGQDLKKPGFGVPGVTWGSNRGIFGFPGHFAPPWPYYPLLPRFGMSLLAGVYIFLSVL